jgi:hypothetical protein
VGCTPYAVMIKLIGHLENHMDMCCHYENLSASPNSLFVLHPLVFEFGFEWGLYFCFLGLNKIKIKILINI